jgi:hypothetical protein
VRAGRRRCPPRFVRYGCVGPAHTGTCLHSDPSTGRPSIGKLVAGLQGIREPTLLSVQIQQPTTALRSESPRSDEVPAVAHPGCLAGLWLA